MYQAKQAGRDTFRFFTAEMNDEVLARLELEAALRAALSTTTNSSCYYQPKVQLDSGRIAGVEALLRWQRPGHGMVSPDVFMPVLEETGLIVPVGRWVHRAACRQIARLVAIGGRAGAGLGQRVRAPVRRRRPERRRAATAIAEHRRRRPSCSNWS